MTDLSHRISDETGKNKEIKKPKKITRDDSLRRGANSTPGTREKHEIRGASIKKRS